MSHPSWAPAVWDTPGALIFGRRLSAFDCAGNRGRVNADGKEREPVLKLRMKFLGLVLGTFARPARGSRLGIPLLLLLALLLGAASSAQAAGDMCSDYPNGVIDGSQLNISQLPSTLGIDRDCTIKNFPQSVGGLPFTLINFQFPEHASYLIVFDNVYYTGNMSCNDPTQSTFSMWWSNGSYNNISSSCQAFIIPVDGIHKVNPVGQTTAAIGAPFP